MTDSKSAPKDPALEQETEVEVEASWYVYLLRSEARATTYVGIAKDVERRLEQHNGTLKGGAKATRAARPWRVDLVEGPYASRSEAQVAEAELRRRRDAGAL